MKYTTPGGTPIQMKSKYVGKCAQCGGRIRVGETIIWSPSSSLVYHPNFCGKIGQPLDDKWEKRKKARLKKLKAKRKEREHFNPTGH